jgi:hypothetical protein
MPDGGQTGAKRGCPTGARQGPDGMPDGGQTVARRGQTGARQGLDGARQGGGQKDYLL